MNIETKAIFIVIYVIIMLLFYAFIIKRLSHLNKKHIKHSYVSILNTNHKSLIIRVSIIWLLAILVSVALIVNI